MKRIFRWDRALSARVASVAEAIHPCFPATRRLSAAAFARAKCLYSHNSAD